MLLSLYLQHRGKWQHSGRFQFRLPGSTKWNRINSRSCNYYHPAVVHPHIAFVWLMMKVVGDWRARADVMEPCIRK